MKADEFSAWLENGMSPRAKDPDPVYPLPDTITAEHGIKRFEVSGERATLGCDLALGRGIGCSWTTEGVTVDIDYQGARARLKLDKYAPTHRPGIVDGDGHETRAPTPFDVECYVMEGVLKSLEASPLEPLKHTGQLRDEIKAFNKEVWPCQYCEAIGWPERDGKRVKCKECDGHGWAVKCRECGGTGHTRHGVYCEMCNETGQVGQGLSDGFKESHFKAKRDRLRTADMVISLKKSKP